MSAYPFCKATSGRQPEIVSWESVKPAAENQLLYAHFDIRNADDCTLCESIRDRGILEPLIVDADNVILSGHRRHAAAFSAGFDHVPIRRETFRLADMQPAERLKVLTSYNSQRSKSAEEQAREVLVTVNPADAWQAVRDRIAERDRQAFASPPDAMQVNASSSGRAVLSPAKNLLLKAVQNIVAALREYWPLSVRQIHYGLLNDPPLIHAGKKNSRYRNNKASYRAAVDLCARGRLAGLIPWASISDETRPVELWQTHATPRDFVEHEARYFLGCYRRDLMQSQLRHIELVVEKNTAAELVRRVAMDYCIPVTSGRGFCSLEPRRQIAERFRRSGKASLVLVLISDADPDGDEVSQSIIRSLREDFAISCEAVRAALTPEQARDYGLPVNHDAKSSSPNFKKFVERHGGTAVYELEAVPPEILQSLVRQAIEGVLDMAAYDCEVEQWQRESAGLEVVRRKALEAVLNTRI